MHSAFEPFYLLVSFAGVFLTDAAVDALAPQVKAAALERAAHEGDGVGFSVAKLMKNGFEWRTVFPSHFDDAVAVLFGQRVGVFGRHIEINTPKTKWLRV